ncbi:hypothetical protein [Ekhidna sp.]|jgi:enoyl-[acyl-carrier-protein] reductase (NADH)|uniref:hypothetical protein n=1 Tax=Ekhidna sp. TaxID=2608089 RepID=UPI0032EB52A5
MLIPFDQMPDNARLWIYQAERKLKPEEVRFVEENTNNFLNQWQAHGQDLKASFSVEYDQFLIISVDESFSQASGCSIDASVHLIKALEKELGVSFMTTSQVAFLQNEQINLYPFNQLKAQAEGQVITPETLVFDNTVRNVAQFREGWLKESGKTWVKRYFS